VQKKPLTNTTSCHTLTPDMAQDLGGALFLLLMMLAFAWLPRTGRRV